MVDAHRHLMPLPRRGLVAAMVEQVVGVDVHFQVPRDFDGAFRQVVRARLEWSLREGMRLYPETVELWNAVR